MGNFILFPAQTSTYTLDTSGVKDHLVWIPQSYSSPETTSQRFPCLWLNSGSQHTLLYFHGNSVDLGDISDEIIFLCNHVHCNLLAIEFPGYGMCANISVDADRIDKWGLSAFHWLMSLGVNPMSIIPFGRSIGTGPAAKVAAILMKQGINTGGLILHCPYLSIHKLVSDYTSLGTWIIGNYWDIEESLSKLYPTTPLLIIHGLNDETIPVVHGQTLLKNYAVDKSLKTGFFPEDSPHNAYLILDHLGVPIKAFLENKALSRLCKPFIINIPPRDLEPPSEKLTNPSQTLQQALLTTSSAVTSEILENVTGKRRSSFIEDTASKELLSSIRSLTELKGPAAD